MEASKQLRLRALDRLRGQWGLAVGLTLAYLVIVTGLEYVPYIGKIVLFLVSGALAFGMAFFYIKLSRRQNPEFMDLFAGFESNYARNFITGLLVAVFVLLWTLLLVIPGIIAAYRYALTWYILVDRPELTPSQAIEESKRLMHGRKMDLFLLHLSFIGWALLSVLTFGIGFLWLCPYLYTATAEFYEDARKAG